MVKNPPANAGDTEDAGLIPGLGKSSGVGNDNPLQYSCLENLVGRRAWRAAVPGVAESGTTKHASHTAMRVDGKPCRWGGQHAGRRGFARLAVKTPFLLVTLPVSVV